MRAIPFVCFLLAGLSRPIGAANPAEWRFWDSNDGLADRYVDSISRDKRGAIWATHGDQRAISRFDGLNFERLQTPFPYNDHRFDTLDGKSGWAFEEDGLGHLLGWEKPANAVVNLENVKVLIVDDNATNRSVLNGLLERWRMRCASADSGLAALQLLEHETFDMMLLDVTMPEMDGFMLAERILERWPDSGMKIVMLTSFGQRGDAVRCRSLKIGAYLNKPINKLDLLQTLQAFRAPTASALEGAIPPLITHHTLREQTVLRKATRALRVLVAEDNQINQKLAKRMLEKMGHHVTTAANGLLALESFKNQPFDLILMDVQMPEMSGLEAAAAIRDWEGTGPRIPIFALTANAMASDREDCFRAGMDAYISKPILVDELFDAIEKYYSDALVEALS